MGTGPRGRRVNAQRIGRALQVSQPSGVLSFRRENGKHLKVTQLGHPGQQIGDEQHAQPADVRFPVRHGHVFAYPQQARAGRPDLGV